MRWNLPKFHYYYIEIEPLDFLDSSLLRLLCKEVSSRCLFQELHGVLSSKSRRLKDIWNQFFTAYSHDMNSMAHGFLF